MNETTIIRSPQVEAETGFSRSTILRRQHAGLFPRPIALGRRSVGWRAKEVAAINAAVIRGASEDEQRQLVQQLEARRKNINPENTMSAPVDQDGTRSASHRAHGARLNESIKS